MATTDKRSYEATAAELTARAERAENALRSATVEIDELCELIRLYAHNLSAAGWSAEPFFDPEAFEPEQFPPDAIRERELFDKHKRLIWGNGEPPKPSTSRGWFDQETP